MVRHLALSLSSAACVAVSASVADASAFNAGREIAYAGAGGGYATIITDINNHGDLSGYGFRDDGWVQYNHAILYDYDADAFAYITNGRAYGLNDHNQVVGQSYHTSASSRGGFVWQQGGTPTYLGQSKGIAIAFDINNHGRLAGRGGPGGELIAYTVGSVDDAELQGYPAGYNQYVQQYDHYRASINDRHVVADSARAWGRDEKPQRAFVKPTVAIGNGPWSGIDMSFRFMNGTDVGSSHAHAINNHGVVVGEIANRPAVWGPSGNWMTIGGNQPGLLSLGVAKDVNDHGVVVGQALFGDNYEQRAFIWRNGYAVDLNTLVDLGPNGRLIDATGINDKGQIVGIVRMHNEYNVTRLIEPNVGASQFTPRLPDYFVPSIGAHVFENVASGQWFDPVSAYGFSFEMTTVGSGFDRIIEMPQGFGTLTVSVDGETFVLNAGDSLDLDGATSFVVTWDPILFETLGELSFPIALDFTTPIASFTMTPLTIVPEPASLVLLASCSVLIRRRRRD